jgi:hypothetical protein
LRVGNTLSNSQASGSSKPIKATASATLNATWNSHLRHVGLNCAQNVGDGLQEWRKQRDADEPIEQVSDRQPVTRGIVAVTTLDHTRAGRDDDSSTELAR